MACSLVIRHINRRVRNVVDRRVEQLVAAPHVRGEALVLAEAILADDDAAKKHVLGPISVGKDVLDPRQDLLKRQARGAAADTCNGRTPVGPGVGGGGYM